MQSSAENQQPAVVSAAPVAPAPAPAGDEKMLAALKQLENLGHPRRSLRLLQKTNGDVEVVREFLVARKKLFGAILASRKEGKHCCHRKELKAMWKHRMCQKEGGMSKHGMCFNKERAMWKHGHCSRKEGAMWKHGMCSPKEGSMWKHGPCSQKEGSMWKHGMCFNKEGAMWKHGHCFRKEGAMWKHGMCSQKEGAMWKHGHCHKSKEERDALKAEWKKSICGRFRHGHRFMREEGEAPEDPVDASVAAKILPALNVWPPQISRLYLAGKSLLFAAAPLRRMAFRHRERDSAKLILSSIASEFSKLLPAVQTTMVFGSVESTISQSYSGDNLQVLSAKPAFATSDDALVHWAKQNAENHVLSMVVTADRGLQKRLSEYPGVVLVRPKVWMAFVAFMLDKKQPTAGETPASIDLDQWMSLWIQKMDNTQSRDEEIAVQLQDSLKVSNAN